MARRLVSGLAADHNDVKLVDDSSPSWLSLQATSPAPNSYAPPSGAHRWIRIEGNSGTTNNVGAPTGGPSNLYGTAGYTPAYFVGAFVIEATFLTGDASRIARIDMETSGDINLEVVYVSATTFNLRLTQTNSRTLIGTGSSVFTTLEIVYFRISLDGTNIELHARENNSDLSGLSAEVSAAETDGPNDNRAINIRAYDNVLDAGDYIYWDATGIIDADTTADRPNGDWTVNRLDGNGEGTAQDYGDETTCAGGGGVVADVQLDGSLLVDESIFWCEEAGANGSQEITLDDFTPSSTLCGLTATYFVKANVAAKTVATWLRLLDASNTSEWQNPNIALTTWVRLIAVFERDPSGNEWADLSDLNAIETGIRSISTNGAEDRCSALIIQAYEIGDDPPATGADRRRLLAA